MFGYATNNDNKLKAGVYMMDKSKEELCDICFRNESNAFFEPCMHGGICQSCIENIAYKDKRCPFCRQVTFF